MLLLRAVHHLAAGTKQAAQLHSATYGVSKQAIRRQLKLRLPAVAAGDQLVVSALPRANHDCDGVFIGNWQFWRAADADELSLSS